MMVETKMTMMLLQRPKASLSTFHLRVLLWMAVLLNLFKSTVCSPPGGAGVLGVDAER